MMYEQYPVFANGKLDLALMSRLHGHEILASHPSQLGTLKKLLQSAGRVFGTTLTVGSSGLSYDNSFHIIVRQEAHAESPYLSGAGQEIFIAKADYHNSLGMAFSLDFTLNSEVAQSALSHYKNTWSTFKFDAALLTFQAYERGVKKYVKKHSLNRQQAINFANALEIYSQYATNTGLPTNTVNHIARAIKGGLTVDKAIWMVSSNVPSELADEFVDIPLNWLDKLY